MKLLLAGVAMCALASPAFAQYYYYAPPPRPRIVVPAPRIVVPGPTYAYPGYGYRWGGGGGWHGNHAWHGDHDRGDTHVDVDVQNGGHHHGHHGQ